MDSGSIPVTPEAAAPGTFQALLPGRERLVRRILVDIAQELWVHRAQLPVPLASGLPGAALFFSHLARLPGFEPWEARSTTLLEMAVDQLGQNPAASLYGGYVGVAWAIELLVGPDVDGEDLNEDVDAILLESLRGQGWNRHFDLVSGLTGIGTYALQRLPRPSARAILERVLDHLEGMSVPDGHERSWPTPLALMAPWAREQCPGGLWDLGVAHGLPGVLHVLAAMEAAGIGGGRALRLYSEGMAWLRSRLQDPAQGSYLAAWIPQGVPAPPPSRARIGWCYGDLGASVALFWAARHLGHGEDLPLAMARLAAARPLEDASLYDACLCHGSAGNAHLFNRLFQATGEDCFRIAAERYLQDVLRRRCKGAGFAGFRHYAPDRESDSIEAGVEDPDSYKPAPGLLEGAAGIGLVLLAALGGPEPTWDRFMLMS